MSKGTFNVNKENLEKMHGDKAVEVFNEIRDLGGYGDVTMDNPGGLGILGAIREDNTAISNKDKDRIAELAGVSRKEADTLKSVGAPRTNLPKEEKE